MNNENNNLSQRILQYLEKHPQAGDTLEGIVTWWLEQDRIDHLVNEVAEALRSLAHKGAIQTHTSQSGTTIYKIKK